MPVPYLMYHELHRSGRGLCDDAPGYRRYVVEEDAFGAQLDRLAALGLEGTNVSTALDEPDARAAAITFDDGCETDLLMAAPALRSRGLGATFYVSTGQLAARGYLSSLQVRELAGLGFEIGCHGATHRFLPDLTAAELAREIADPKARLEDLVGAPVVHFSCPGGRWDVRVAEVARRAGYRSVATSRPIANRPATNRYCLGRTAIFSTTTLAEFDRICSGRGSRLRRIRTAMLDAAKSSLGNDAYDRVRALLLWEGR